MCLYPGYQVWGKGSLSQLLLLVLKWLVLLFLFIDILLSFVMGGSCLVLAIPQHLCRGVYSFSFSVHLFVCLFASLFLIPSVTSVEFTTKLWLKFLLWCFSH